MPHPNKSMSNERIFLFVAFVLLPFAVTLGLGYVWIYLTLIPVSIFGLILFFVGLLSSRSHSEARHLWQMPGLLFVSSTLGTIAALATTN